MHFPTTYLYSSTYVGAFPTTVTNAKNQSTTHTYDFNTGLLTSTTDPNSQTTSYTYDNLWRLASVTYPDGGSAVVTRQEASFPNTAKLTKTIQLSPAPLNLVETNVFDGMGRVSQNQLTDPQGTIYTTHNLRRRWTQSFDYEPISDNKRSNLRNHILCLRRTRSYVRGRSARGNSCRWLCLSGLPTVQRCLHHLRG